MMEAWSLTYQSICTSEDHMKMHTYTKTINETILGTFHRGHKVSLQCTVDLGPDLLQAPLEREFEEKRSIILVASEMSDFHISNSLNA